MQDRDGKNNNENNGHSTSPRSHLTLSGNSPPFRKDNNKQTTNSTLEKPPKSFATSLCVCNGVICMQIVKQIQYNIIQYNTMQI